eukprot:4865149-Lingulodinium_polyedra.AAC.1
MVLGPQVNADCIVGREADATALDGTGEGVHRLLCWRKLVHFRLPRSSRCHTRRRNRRSEVPGPVLCQ